VRASACCQDALGHEVQDRLAVEPPLQVDLCGQAVAEVHPDEVAQVELLDCRIRSGIVGKLVPGDIWLLR
jgi:hypothetical protein